MSPETFNPARCWYCAGTGAVTVVEGLDATHGNLNQETCPVCDGAPLKNGFMMGYVPFDGVWFLARWYEHNEGHHVLLARSHRQLQKMVEILVAKEPDAEIKECWAVEFVAPSRAVQRAYVAHLAEAVELSFWHWIGDRVRTLLERKEPLPTPLVPCTDYRYTDDDGDGDTDNTASRDTNHALCANCHDGVRVVGCDDREWYLTRRTAYLRVVRNAQTERRKYGRARVERVPSRARGAADDERVSYIGQDFGAHDGLFLKAFDPADADAVTSVCQTPPLAWFRKLNPVSCGEFTQMFAATRAAAERNRAERALVDADRRRRAADTQLAEFLALVRS